ncbi:methyltransferase domain-containing protein [Chloroflexota bacterium]
MAEGAEFRIDRDLVRERFIKYTRKAFSMLSPLDKPRILDLGCGSGVSTIELARLGQGEVTGIDIDQYALDKFARKIEEAGLTDRVKAINCSMLDIDFPDESFDIVWSEGSIFAVGFEKGLRDWKRLLKPGGYIMVHDEAGNITEKMEQILNCGYDLLGHFVLDQDTWWREYYTPLKKMVDEARPAYADDSEVPEELKAAEREIEMFEKYPERNNSVCFVMRKR